MSVLETPRVLFKGTMSWDPIVTNNLAPAYDEANATTVFNVAETVKAYRAAAIANVASSVNWNPDGTHRSAFFSTCVSGVDVGNGVSTDDPLIGAPVSLLGMLVDAEPYGVFTSQLFFDAMSFGIAGGCQVKAPRSQRVTSRQINFGRNLTYRYKAGVASVVWQTSFATADGLKLYPHDSPALQALAQAMAEDPTVIGLTLRWNSYRTLYFDSADVTQNPKLAQELADKLKLGGFQPNPARSDVVGVLGLWRQGEPANEPGDRTLLNAENPKGPSIGTASARLTPTSLTLDLANSISETGVDLTKQDLGPLTAVAVAADGTTVLAQLGTFAYADYDKDAYDKSSGIVVLPLDADAAQAAADNDIQLRGADGTVYLAEAAIRAYPLTPNLYIDEGDNTQVQVQVYDRGLPAGGGIEVTMVPVNPSTPVMGSVTTDPSGLAAFPLTGVQGQVEGYVLLTGPDPTPPPGGIDPQTTTYLYVRTLPADDNIAAMAPTWANVHEFVLSNWQAMAPCMDNWLDLGSEAQVKSYGPLIRKLTDPGYFEAFRYMPVTRDLSKGSRTLLYAFLDGGKKTLKAAAPHKPSNLELSRAMRR
ncbi:hypothetical protein QO010_002772 [Caulobacter ginsengisoli]|uniref:Uncharacterized protein n=1 Tax=Caulobacter ginsengisoli TaxID=400775 RepID=A0ABU0ISK1_9CAUL|nr:hypothetical protein [Caulobacter ginsengisoli]MDQ0464988.1 hypothetical protein [Caulobacter ginsengisoli]